MAGQLYLPSTVCAVDEGKSCSLKTSQSPSMVQNVQSTHKLHMLAHKQEVRSVFNLPAGGSWERPTWDVSTKARCVDSVAWRNWANFLSSDFAELEALRVVRLHSGPAMTEARNCAFRRFLAATRRMGQILFECIERTARLGGNSARTHGHWWHGCCWCHGCCGSKLRCGCLQLWTHELLQRRLAPSFLGLFLRNLELWTIQALRQFRKQVEDILGILRIAGFLVISLSHGSFYNLQCQRHELGAGQIQTFWLFHFWSFLSVLGSFNDFQRQWHEFFTCQWCFFFRLLHFYTFFRLLGSLYNFQSQWHEFLSCQSWCFFRFHWFHWFRCKLVSLWNRFCRWYLLSQFRPRRFLPLFLPIGRA